MSVTVTWFLIGLLLGLFIGWALCTIILPRSKTEIDTGKLKVKGKGNTLNSDYDIKAGQEKKDRKKLFKRKKDNNLADN